MRISDWSSDVCPSDLDYLADGRLLRVGNPRHVGNLHEVEVVQQADPHDAAEDMQPAKEERAEGAAVVALRAEIEQQKQGCQHEAGDDSRSEEHTSELQSLMRNSYAVCCLQQKKKIHTKTQTN